MEFIKKWKNEIIIMLLLVVVCVMGVTGFVVNNKYKTTILQNNETIKSLSNTIDTDIGPTVDCYVVKQDVRAGDQITEDKLVAVSIPEKIAYCNRSSNNDIPSPEKNNIVQSTQSDSTDTSKDSDTSKDGDTKADDAKQSPLPESTPTTKDDSNGDTEAKTTAFTKKPLIATTLGKGPDESSDGGDVSSAVISQDKQDSNKEKALNVITSLNDVVGKYFRVDMTEGSILLTDYVMEKKIDNSSRYYELSLDEFPTDIKVGDYVDIRIQFTYGEDFIALPHRRIEKMSLENGVFTFVFNEEDIYTYNSMLLDKAMYPDVKLYMLKYVDSSSQQAAEAYYPINDNISDVVDVNPNILNAAKEEMKLKRQQLNSTLGGDIKTFDEKQLEKVRDYLEDIRQNNESSKTQTIKDRIKLEEEEAKEAASA